MDSLRLTTECSSAWSQVTDGNHLGSVLLNVGSQAIIGGDAGALGLSLASQQDSRVLFRELPVSMK